MSDIQLITNYTPDDLEETLGEKNQVRTRPAIYFGTNDVNGCLNGVMEIVTNGTDEATTLRKMGVKNNGTFIKTIIEKDVAAIQSGDIDSSYIVTVIDDGRGVPMDWNSKKQKYAWWMVYNQLFASGKRGGSSAYNGAAGLNGVGAAITQFTSEWMTVISRRIEQLPNGKTKNVEYEMHFEDGEPKGEFIKRDWRTGKDNITGLATTGTYVQYKTDPRFFLDTHYTYEMVADRLRKLATVSDGVRYDLTFLDEGNVSFCFDNGAVDFLKSIIQEPLLKEPVRIVGSEGCDDTFMGEQVHYTIGVDCTIDFSNVFGFVESYHNSSYTPENGTHYLGARDAVKDILESFGQKEGKLGKKEKILNADLDDLLCIVCASSISPGEYSSWSGQDKRAINNASLYNSFRTVITNELRNWLTLHKEEALKIVQAILLRKEAREKADQVKKKLVKQMSANPNELKSRPEKLHDCSSRDINENEIFIVEGDSAEGSALTARNAITQATYPLTGVILNCEKATPEQIFNNRVIRELIQIHGCGIDVPTTDKHFAKILKDLPRFDITKANYGKYIILTDADVDGGHIACLLLVYYAKLMPELLRKGRVYIAEAPLYKINYSTGNYAYAYSDEERNELIKKANTLKIKIKYINRFKGLGEMSVEEMSESVMDPKTRRLIPVDFTDEAGFHQMMKDLLGDNLDERRAWIRSYFEDVTEVELEGEQQYMLENGVVE